MGVGEAANIAKTCANVYRIFAYFCNSSIFLYSPNVAPAAIPNWPSPAWFEALGGRNLGDDVAWAVIRPLAPYVLVYVTPFPRHAEAKGQRMY